MYINLSDIESIILRGEWSNEHELIDEIKRGPAADVRENVKGEWTKKWKYGIHYVACSECGYEPRYEGVYIMPSSNTLLFCPNCGADMRGDNNEY